MQVAGERSWSMLIAEFSLGSVDEEQRLPKEPATKCAVQKASHPAKETTCGIHASGCSNTVVGVPGTDVAVWLQCATVIRLEFWPLLGLFYRLVVLNDSGERGYSVWK